MKIRTEIRQSEKGFHRAFLVNVETEKSIFQTSRRYKTKEAAGLDVSRLKMAFCRRAYTSALVGWLAAVVTFLWALSL